MTVTVGPDVARETVNLDIISDRTVTLTVTVKDSAGAVVDLTDALPVWSYSSTPSGVPVKTLDTVVGGIVLDADPTTGIFTITISPDDTDNQAGLFYHEAVLTYIDGRVIPLMTGRLVLRAPMIEAS